MSRKTWTVWVGGVEVNDYVLTAEEAHRSAQAWVSAGYDDVVAEMVEVPEG